MRWWASISRSIAPASLFGGGKLAERRVGVVEADFFDWVVRVPGGEPFVRSLARPVGKFRWQEIGGDVLEVLYESVVTAPTHKLWANVTRQTGSPSRSSRPR